MSFLPGWFFRSPARPPVRALGLAAVAGLAVAAGQAPLGWWWLALPALSALTLLVAAAGGVARAAWTGWAGGVGYFAGAMFWIVEPFLVEPEVYGWMAPFALVLLSGGMALFWGLAGAGTALGRSRGGRALGFAAVLAATDLARGYILTGFPWALVGHIWIGTPVAQAATLGGAVGLSLITLVAASLPWLGDRPLSRGLGAGAAVLALGAVWLGGAHRLDAPEAPRETPVRVRLLQPNAAQELKWRDDMWRMFLDRLFEQTAKPADAPLDLVVWPETAVPFLMENTGALYEDMVVASGGVPVAFGIQRQEGMRFYNSMAVIDGNGAVTHVYDKHHLTPFGEYMPAGDLLGRLGITAFAAQVGNGYSPGTGAAVLDLGRAGKVLPLICYEAIFPQDLRAAPARADWILQITNDGWFGDLSGPYQHLAQTRLRAIEQGLPLLRSANTGVTAVIDAKGRVMASLPLNTEGLLDAEVPGSLAPPLYARTGDWPVGGVIVAALGALALFRRRGTIDPARAAR